MNEQNANDNLGLASRSHSLAHATLAAPVRAAALALVIAMGGAGCLSPADPADLADPADEPAPEATSTASSALMSFPSTCAQMAAAAPSGPLDDGEYLLFVGGDPAKPWVAYCLGMAGSAPKEYLTLHRTGASSNFSQYTAGGASPGTSARSRYTKVRIDPASLVIDSSDQTFSTASGLVHHGATDVTSMPFGVAMSCDATASGVGNIDLQGTPFAVSANAFLVGGSAPQGGAVYSASNQVVSLTGGGYCGSTQPAPGIFNPFNNRGGAFLALVHL